MKACIVYHPDSDHARAVDQYAHDLESQRGVKLGLLSLETPQGDETAKLYGVMSYPSLIISEDNGQLIKFWQGLPLPLMDEVMAYLNN